MTPMFLGDDVLNEFGYGEVRDGSITRRAQEVKTNFLKKVFIQL